MLSLSHGLPADPAYQKSHTVDGEVLPPAEGFSHNGRLNMGPAIFLAVALSLMGWAGIFGIGYLVYHLF